MALRTTAASRTDRVKRPHVVQGEIEGQNPKPAHAPIGRLQPDHSAVRRRDADRPAGVGPHRGEHHIRRNRGARSAARSAGNPAGVVGVAHRAEMRVSRRDPVRQLVQVGFADQDGASRRQPLDHSRVMCRDVLGEQLRTRRGRHAAGRENVLDGDGDSEQGGMVSSTRQFLVGKPRRLTRALFHHCDEGVEFRIQNRNPPQALFDQFHRRDLFRAQQARRFEDGHASSSGAALNTVAGSVSSGTSRMRGARTVSSSSSTAAIRASSGSGRLKPRACAILRQSCHARILY